MLEWLHDLPAEPIEIILKIQDVDQSRIKYISDDNTQSNWFAPDGPLCVPEFKLNSLILGERQELRLIFCPGSGGKSQPHGNFYDQKMIIDKGHMGTGNGGENHKKSRLLDKFLSHILIYQITARTTSL